MKLRRGPQQLRRVGIPLLNIHVIVNAIRQFPKGTMFITSLYQYKETVELEIRLTPAAWCPFQDFALLSVLWLLWAQRDKGTHWFSTMCWRHSEQAVGDDARPHANYTATYSEADEFFRCQESVSQEEFPQNILHLLNFFVVDLNIATAHLNVEPCGYMSPIEQMSQIIWDISKWEPANCLIFLKAFALHTCP